jgi:hypothetical protein
MIFGNGGPVGCAPSTPFVFPAYSVCSVPLFASYDRGEDVTKQAQKQRNTAFKFHFKKDKVDEEGNVRRGPPVLVLGRRVSSCATLRVALLPLGRRRRGLSTRRRGRKSLSILRWMSRVGPRRNRDPLSRRYASEGSAWAPGDVC